MLSLPRLHTHEKHVEKTGKKAGSILSLTNNLSRSRTSITETVSFSIAEQKRFSLSFFAEAENPLSLSSRQNSSPEQQLSLSSFAPEQKTVTSWFSLFMQNWKTERPSVFLSSPEQKNKKDFNAKLSGFEVAKLVHGDSYKEKIIDPLYFHPLQTNKDTLGVEDQIHALGEVLIQILTGRCISESDLANIKEAMNVEEELSTESFRRALDPHLHNLDNTLVGGARSLAELAFRLLENPSYLSPEVLDWLGHFYTMMMKYYEQSKCLSI